MEQPGGHRPSDIGQDSGDDPKSLSWCLRSRGLLLSLRNVGVLREALGKPHSSSRHCLSWDPQAGICASDSTWDRPHPPMFDSVGLGWDLDVHVFKSSRYFRYRSWDDNP